MIFEKFNGIFHFCLFYSIKLLQTELIGFTGDYKPIAVFVQQCSHILTEPSVFIWINCSGKDPPSLYKTVRSILFTKDIKRLTYTWHPSSWLSAGNLWFLLSCEATGKKKKTDIFRLSITDYHRFRIDKSMLVDRWNCRFCKRSKLSTWSIIILARV